MDKKDVQKMAGFYQSEILNLFEKELKKRKWRIVKRTYGNDSKKDINALVWEVDIGDGEEPLFLAFSNAWWDFLFIDRDEVPRRVDRQILNAAYGMAKVRHAVLERMELYDAVINRDQKKIEEIKKRMRRVRVIKTPEKDLN